MNQAKFEERVGLTKLRAKHGKDRSKARIFPILKTESTIPLSNGFAKGGFKKDSLEHRWKRGKEESENTLREIEK